MTMCLLKRDFLVSVKHYIVDAKIKIMITPLVYILKVNKVVNTANNNFSVMLAVLRKLAGLWS